MRYLTYEEYQNYGGELDETTFDSFEFQAEVEVDWYTFARLRSGMPSSEDDCERIKRCMYELVKLLHSKAQAQELPTVTGETTSGGVASILSQSNDGVSISYNSLSASDIVKNSRREIQSYIQKYLNHVMDSLGRPLLYRGIYPGE